MLYGVNAKQPDNSQEEAMYALDQTLVGSYHAAELRAEARRDALARSAAPSTHPRTLRQLARRLGR
jgi:hypothetical protein